MSKNNLHWGQNSIAPNHSAIFSKPITQTKNLKQPMKSDNTPINAIALDLQAPDVRSLESLLRYLDDEAEHERKGTSPLYHSTHVLTGLLEDFTWSDLMVEAELAGLSPTPIQCRTLAKKVCDCEYGWCRHYAEPFDSITEMAGDDTEKFTSFLVALGIINPDWSPTAWLYKVGAVAERTCAVSDDTFETKTSLWLTAGGYRFFGFLWPLYKSYGRYLLKKK
ncbi:MAG: hypothetical protein EOP49_07690 [Sphingobacteriales bacterium]|nr:MAG: hypothetical protein EOP49_07690 [Sphingobacteriales bacterium]